MIHRSDVCVIGNGAIGKTAALGLAQAGLSVTMLVPAAPMPTLAAAPVPAPVPAWDVRVYALNHAARDLLDALRVWDAMDGERIAEVEAMQVKGDGTGGAGRLSFDAYGARVGTLAWIVEDRNLGQALDAALKFAPGLNIVSGRAASLRQSEEIASITLENGDRIEAALMVGADGGNSWVRGQCDIGIDYRSYGQQALVTNFETEHAHQGVAWQWFTGNEGIIALLPLAGQRVSLVWSAPQMLAQSLLSEPLAHLAERLSALPGMPFGQLRPIQPESIKSLPLSLIRAHAMTAPRVALVGDAAHVVHPLAGHGMNLGFADVAVLIKTLAGRSMQTDCGDPQLLGQYARARKEDVWLMQAATDGLERLFSTNLEPVRLLRNLGMSLVDKSPFLKRRLIAHAMGKRF